MCFTTDGKEVWRTDYVKDLGGIVPVWGFSESPLVDGDKLVCTPGTEDGTLMALDKKTGKPIWKCKVPEGPTGDRGFLGKSGAAYASVIAIDFEGVRQYVQLTATTLVGVAAPTASSCGGTTGPPTRTGSTAPRRSTTTAWCSPPRPTTRAGAR